MSHFIVAGAGHGGLTAARHLAGAGHTVEVIEQKAENELGYDWTDVVEPHVCSRNGFEDPPADCFSDAYWNSLISPSKRSIKRPPMLKCREMHIWRKELLQRLVGGCKAAGVAFRFETKLLGPLTEGARVVGVRTDRGDFRADMVIDAAGGLSPIRQGLPASTRVPREIGDTQLFHCWRGLFERLAGEAPQDHFKTYFYHMDHAGISWAIADPKHIDILIGSLNGPLAQEEIDAALADLREDNPLLGTKLLHGGGRGVIPVRRPLGVMVADSYAAVGDSAAMSDAFGGSGVNLAMDAGSLLARVILEDCQGDYSAAKLWKYQYSFFTWKPPAEFPEGVGAKPAEAKAETDVLKSFLVTLRPEEVELLFTRNILTVELAFLGQALGPADALKLVLRNLDKIGLLVKLAKMLNAGGKIKKLTRRIPAEYDPAAVAEWAGAYEAFGRG